MAPERTAPACPNKTRKKRMEAWQQGATGGRFQLPGGRFRLSILFTSILLPMGKSKKPTKRQPTTLPLRGICVGSVASVAAIATIAALAGRSAGVATGVAPVAVKVASKRSVGMTAPSFSAVSHSNELHSLESLSGQRFLLWFYPRASTSG